MYVAKILEKKTGRIILNYVRSHRVNGKVKHEVVEKIGYLDEFEGIYDDPIAHFKELAKQKTENAKNAKITIEVDLNKKITFTDKDKEQSGVKVYDRTLMYGMLPLSGLFHELEIDYFLNNRRRYVDCEYNLNLMFQMLVYGRILFPDSDLNTWKNNNRLIGNLDFSNDDVYRSLPFFAKHKDALISHLDSKITELYGRKSDSKDYVVTSYCWELDESDGIRRTSSSRNSSQKPAVQIGLLMDSQSIPVTYRLFSGNSNEDMTMRPVMGQVPGSLRPENLIYVTDKSLMNADNRAQIILDHSGYVIGSNARGSGIDKETKEWVLEEDGYTDLEDGKARYKERFEPVEVWITDKQTGDRKPVRVNERQVAFWSCKRNSGKPMEDSRPGGYILIRSNIIGSENKDGSTEDRPRFREDNLLELNREVRPTDIINMYKELWKVKACFGITESQMETRPTKDTTEARFLICFVALTILKLLEKKTDGKIPIPQMIDSLQKAKLALADESYGIYLNLYCDAVIRDIGNALHLDLTKERFSRGTLKEMLASSRKS